MTVHEAIRELRGKQSQQAFATRLGLSISTIQKLEKNREPDARSTVRLTRIAVASRQFRVEELLKKHMRKLLDLRENDAFCLNHCVDCWTLEYFDKPPSTRFAVPHTCA